MWTFVQIRFTLNFLLWVTTNNTSASKVISFLAHALSIIPVPFKIISTITIEYFLTFAYFGCSFNYYNISNIPTSKTLIKLNILLLEHLLFT